MTNPQPGRPSHVSRAELRLKQTLLALVNAWPGILWRIGSATPPRLDAKDLQGETAIAVSLRRRRLYLYERGVLQRSYRVAIGGWRARTPRGRFRIGVTLRDPTWYVPDRPERHGRLAGLVVPATDPRNRLGPRWLELRDGIGIHGGPSERWTTGCLRMQDSDVIELFDRVPPGAPVVII